MKWINHELVTGVAVLAATDSILLAGASVLGAVIPDKVEGNPWKEKKPWRWRLTHRGWSHCPSIYLMLISAIYYFFNQKLLVSYTDLWLRDLAIAFLAGAILHIVEDAFCGKVPLVTPAYKIGIRVFKVGTFGEYAFAWCCVILIVLAKLYFLGYWPMLINAFK